MLNPEEPDAYVSNAYILDVRTPAEWKWVGHPGQTTGTTTLGAFLEGKVINIPYWFWEYEPKTDTYRFSNNVNKFFDAEVARQFNPGDTIILMCKSGGRAGYAGTELEDPSQPASRRLEELGSFVVYNITGGFEAGDGWKQSSLPFNQSDAGIWKPSAQRGRSLK
jgi:rhodanese-related sulfurtransferase